MKGLLGKKLGMSGIYNEAGVYIPVTVVQAGPCHIIQKKSKEKDGYSAIQLGFDPKREKNTNKAQIAVFKKLNLAPLRFVKEFRLTEEEVAAFNVGDTLKADLFQPNEWVDAIGTSIGKGFAGVMKRWNFAGAPGSHGTHEYFRHGGSIGTNMTPGHTLKGRKMPGHMGNEKKTIQNLKVVKVIPEKNLLFIKGSIPGHDNSYVIIKSAVKKSA